MDAIWRDIAVWFAGITSGLSVLLYGGIQTKIDKKAEKDAVEDLRDRYNTHQNEISRLYSRMNDAIEDFRSQHDEILRIIHANHLAVIEKIAQKQDRNDNHR